MSQMRTTDDTGEAQTDVSDTFESGRQLFQGLLQFPVEQAIEFQRNAARSLLNGLEMSDYVQRRGIELTRSTLDGYLDTMEQSAEQMTRASEAGFSAMEPGGATSESSMSGQPVRYQGGTRQLAQTGDVTASQPEQFGQAPMGTAQPAQQPIGPVQRPVQSPMGQTTGQFAPPTNAPGQQAPGFTAQATQTPRPPVTTGQQPMALGQSPGQFGPGPESGAPATQPPQPPTMTGQQQITSGTVQQPAAPGQFGQFQTPPTRSVSQQRTPASGETTPQGSIDRGAVGQPVQQQPYQQGLERSEVEANASGPQ
jgi:hypothetical protein